MAHSHSFYRLNDRGQSCLAGAVFKKEDKVIRALLESGADPNVGTPSAAATIQLFKQEETWGKAFEEATAKLEEKKVASA